MKPFLLALLTVALPLASHAGLVIVEDLEQTGPMPLNTQMTIKIEGDEMRMDVGKEISSIINSRTGEVASLMHQQKMAMQLPKGALDAIKQKAAAKKATEKPNLEPTGNNDVINGFKCAEYAGTYQGLKVSYWVTQDIKNADEILAQLGSLSGEADPFKGALANGADFPGFPIRTVVTSPQSGTSTMTIKSIENTTVPSSEFQIPSDYKKMAIPQMQGQGGGSPAIPAVPGSN